MHKPKVRGWITRVAYWAGDYSIDGFSPHPDDRVEIRREIDGEIVHYFRRDVDALSLPDGAEVAVTCPFDNTDRILVGTALKQRVGSRGSLEVLVSDAKGLDWYPLERVWPLVAA